MPLKSDGGVTIWCGGGSPPRNLAEPRRDTSLHLWNILSPVHEIFPFYNQPSTKQKLSTTCNIYMLYYKSINSKFFSLSFNFNTSKLIYSFLSSKIRNYSIDKNRDHDAFGRKIERRGGKLLPLYTRDSFRKTRLHRVTCTFRAERSDSCSPVGCAIRLSRSWWLMIVSG